ncbi:hypothetical protein OH77DRAFT_121604 [Trametes cingulata]|nr:hypothetical protein OH77DRAFT_121604 [Trametes cingulata]
MVSACEPLGASLSHAASPATLWYGRARTSGCWSITPLASSRDAVQVQLVTPRGARSLTRRARSENVKWGCAEHLNTRPDFYALGQTIAAFVVMGPNIFMFAIVSAPLGQQVRQRRSGQELCEFQRRLSM